MTQSPQPKPKKLKRKEKLSDKEQSERFIEAAREVDVDESAGRFKAILSKILQTKYVQKP